MKLYYVIKEEKFDSGEGQDSVFFAPFFRESLSDYLNQAGEASHFKPPADWKPALGKGPHGKPFFTDPALAGIHFSLSHTRGLIAVCFARSELGFDCENITARGGEAGRFERIAVKCFTADERAWFYKAAYSEIAERFFEIWTAKEAYMKYTGNGFSEGFQSFSVLEPPSGVKIKHGRFHDAPHIVYAICAPASADTDATEVRGVL